MEKKINERKEKARNILEDFGEKTQDTISTVAVKTKKGGEFIAKQYNVTKRNIDLKRFRPIFEQDFYSPDFCKPFLLRVVHYNKRMENETCKGAIGFQEEIKNETVMNLYSEFAKQSGINFYPCLEDTIYCADPYRKDFYICLDDYFKYIKKAKVDELELIAQCLGAKYVKISFKERKKVLVSNNEKTGGKASFLIGKGEHEAEHIKQQDEYSSIDVASEVKFDGEEMPTKPQIVYFKGESDIKALIDMRFGKKSQNKMQSKTYTFSCNSRNQMQERTAVNIDFMLKRIGCAGNASVVSEVESVNRTILEYRIEF